MPIPGSQGEGHLGGPTDPWRGPEIDDVLHLDDIFGARTMYFGLTISHANFTKSLDIVILLITWILRFLLNQQKNYV